MLAGSFLGCDRPLWFLNLSRCELKSVLGSAQACFGIWMLLFSTDRLLLLLYQLLHRFRRHFKLFFQHYLLFYDSICWTQFYLRMFLMVSVLSWFNFWSLSPSDVNPPLQSDRSRHHLETRRQVKRNPRQLPKGHRLYYTKTNCTCSGFRGGFSERNYHSLFDHDTTHPEGSITISHLSHSYSFYGADIKHVCSKRCMKNVSPSCFFHII